MDLRVVATSNCLQYFVSVGEMFRYVFMEACTQNSVVSICLAIGLGMVSFGLHVSLPKQGSYDIKDVRHEMSFIVSEEAVQNAVWTEPFVIEGVGYHRGCGVLQRYHAR